jgi:hypothetical protein
MQNLPYPMVFKKYQTIYNFPHPVSQFRHAPGPSHSYPNNPSYPLLFQVHYQDSNTQVRVNNAQVAIIVAYSQNPAVLLPQNISASPKPHGSATFDVSYTNTLHSFHFGSEILNEFHD